MEYSIKLAEITQYDTSRCIEEHIDKTINSILSGEKCTFEDIVTYIENKGLSIYSTNTSNSDWKFVCIVCYVLLKFLDSFKTAKDPLLSVNEQRHVKIALKFIFCFGMLPSFIPGLGLPPAMRRDYKPLKNPPKLKITEKYNRLKFTCNFITLLCKTLEMKMIIYAGFLSDYICGMFLLAYAPLIKPNQNTPTDPNDDFVMTEEKYTELIKDQLYYRRTVEEFTSNVYPPIIMKDLIFLLGVKDPKPPVFILKALVKKLSEFLLAENGVLYVIKCFFDIPNFDVGARWRHVDKLTYLLSVKHGTKGLDKYLENISEQLLSVIKNNQNDYVAVAAACLHVLHEKYPDKTSISNSIKLIISPLLINPKAKNKIGTLVVSAIELDKLIDILTLSFCYSKFSLSGYHLSPILYIMFSIRTKMNNSKQSIDKLNNLILRHFNSRSFLESEWFSCLIFNKEVANVITRPMISIDEAKDGVHLKYSNVPLKVTVEDAVNTLLEMVMNLKDYGNLLACKMFLFCLSSLSDMNCSITQKNDKTLMVAEDEPCDLIDKNSEHYLIFSKALEHLAAMDTVLNFFKEEPTLISNFIVGLFKNSQDDKWFIRNEECISISLVLLSTILSDNDKKIDEMKESLNAIREPLEYLIKKWPQPDVQMLCTEVWELLFEGKGSKHQENSEFEGALTNICDSLLPVRAHGLIELTKLLSKKDTETISKKHYVLCIFQENLKHEDSYIYLNSIKGLAALSNYFPGEVLSMLCKEFISAEDKINLTSSEEDSSIKLRLKIGEILVKITKQLGDMAPAHKVILLNTFLSSCRDPDELIRASSFSNLAELCSILHYKLGNIIYEILKCVQQAIETEKSFECKRAAVLVISSLLKGLGNEALFFLKEALLPVYRTLKQLYHNEKEDQVVRLHAQLALEELNDIVKTLMLPKLDMKKEIIITIPK